MPHAKLPFPPPSGLPRTRHWPRLALFAVRALAELVRARIVFARITVPAIMARNAAVASLPHPPADAALPAWVAYTIPRVARRVPFRSDCLVQALAAQSWLRQAGYEGTIVIGAERPEGGQFAAHAWLTCGKVDLIGGEDGRYTAIV
jgi:Transglutaminase-like superfamily